MGAGVMGASTARALARRHQRVVLLEQFYVGHKRGSSHGRSRIFRLSYQEPEYVRMAQEALPLWCRLEEETGADLLTVTGGIDIGPAIDANASALKQCGAPFDWLDGAELNRRFELLALPEAEPALYQPDAGVVAADDAVAAFVRSASDAGGELRESAKVTRLEPRGDSVTVHADGASFTAGVAVVTAGAWSRGLLDQVGIELRVVPTRETVAYFNLDGTLPPALVEWKSGGRALYALGSPGQGLKAGDHRTGPTCDPDEEGPPDDATIERLSRWVAERYPGVDPTPHLYETCLYTNTSDESFILERHGPIVVGSPCSGHGFKFAPLIGERLADLAAS